MATYKERLIEFQDKMKEWCKTTLSNDEDIKKYYNENQEDKDTLNILAQFYLNSAITGCGNCLVDYTARILAIDPNSDVANKEICLFSLFAGALLQDTENYDSSKNVSNWNLTNENAIWHLKQDKKKIRFFSKYPENWEDLLVDNSQKEQEKKSIKKKQS